MPKNPDDQLSDVAQRAGQLMLEITDHLASEDDAAAVLTGLGAAVVFQLDRFGESIEKFADTLRQMRKGRAAELARRKREN